MTRDQDDKAREVAKTVSPRWAGRPVSPVEGHDFDYQIMATRTLVRRIRDRVMRREPATVTVTARTQSEAALQLAIETNERAMTEATNDREAVALAVEHHKLRRRLLELRITLDRILTADTYDGRCPNCHKTINLNVAEKYRQEI